MSVDMILVADLVAPLAAIDTRERTAAHPGANPARRWSPDLLDAFDIPAKWMPAVLEGPDVSGHVTDAMASQLGLPAGIPVAAGVFYPLFGILLSPLIAGAAMAFSSVTVVTNANRLRSFKPRRLAESGSG